MAALLLGRHLQSWSTPCTQGAEEEAVEWPLGAAPASRGVGGGRPPGASSADVPAGNRRHRVRAGQPCQQWESHREPPGLDRGLRGPLGVCASRFPSSQQPATATLSLWSGPAILSFLQLLIVVDTTTTRTQQVPSKAPWTEERGDGGSWRAPGDPREQQNL